jgi:hypothetical protein
LLRRPRCCPEHGFHHGLLVNPLHLTAPVRARWYRDSLVPLVSGHAVADDIEHAYQGR